MNTEMNDKLDLLIAFSAADCEQEEVEMFRNLDTSGVTLSGDFYAKQRRLVRRYKRKPALVLLRKCLVHAAVVLMAVMSVAFLTAMAIPNVRNAIFDAVVEWYDDYILVRFEPNGEAGSDGPDTSLNSEATDSGHESDGSQIEITPAEKIEKVMKPSYVPEGAEEDIVNISKSSAIIDYYLADNLILSFTQTLYNSKDKLYDNKTSVSHNIEVGGYSAVALEFESSGRAIIWTDGVYYYYVHSATLDVDELIKIASSVQ